MKYLRPLSSLLGLFALTALLANCSKDAKESAKNGKGSGTAPLVQVAKPLQQTMQVFAESIGVLESSNTVEIRARVGGFLNRIAFKDGALVKAGDLLFSIDPRPFEAALAQAQAQVTQAEAALSNAKKDLPRYRNLVKVHAVSKQQLDNVETTYLRALAEKKAGEAARERARLDLEYTRMTSPITGKIGRAEIKQGALISIGTTLLATVSSVNPMYVNFALSERDFLDLSKSENFKNGNYPKVDLFLADGSLYPEQGVIDFRDRAVDSRTGTLAFRATIPNPDGILLPGGYAKVRILIGEGQNTLLVTQRSVIEVQGSQSVWVLDQNQKPKSVQVEVGRRLGSLWEITKGLSPDQSVVIEGTQKIKAGSALKVEQVAMKGSSDGENTDKIQITQASAEQPGQASNDKASPSPSPSPAEKK